ncbi:MAG: hypothetical protein F4Y62_03555 [Rhodospirillaceae bacterium]|nr:hypothetical protein [Rhodospirillaceae bacterium]
MMRSLLYTGVARVKRLAVLAGQKKPAAIAVGNASGGRPHALGHRTGIPALAADRATCYHQHATKPAQDGAIDGSTPRAGSDIREIEPARLRSDDGIRLPAAG